MKKLISTLLVALILLPNLVFAKQEKQEKAWWEEFWSIEYLWKDVFGFPADWIQPRNLIFNFIVPFIALFAVILGMLRNLRIFPRTPSIEIVIAFAMAFMTLPSHIFVVFVSWSLSVAGMWAYVLFLAMFVGGSWFYSVGFLRRKQTAAGIYSTYEKERKSLELQLGIIRGEIVKKTQELPKASGENLARLLREIEELKDKEKKIMEQIDALRYSIRY
jgi:hypothetical protein